MINTGTPPHTTYKRMMPLITLKPEPSALPPILPESDIHYTYDDFNPTIECSIFEDVIAKHCFTHEIKNDLQFLTNISHSLVQ